MYNLILTACMVASFATNGGACLTPILGVYPNEIDCQMDKRSAIAKWLLLNDGYQVEDVNCVTSTKGK